MNKLSDGVKSCLGVGFVLAALALAVISLVAGGVGSIVNWLGGESFGLDLRTGTIIGVGVFVFFFVLAVYMFISVRDYSWFPAIFSGLYAIVPDLILGPQDDFLAMIAGVVISGFLAWRRQKGLAKG